MRVLHVSLGLPPLRTGGLTRYSIELMEAQLEHGYRVSLLYPGRFLRGATRFKRGTWHGIATYEVVNPLPVPLTYGVAEPSDFMVPCDAPEAYAGLLASLKPDIIHVHTFQGIHKEFFDAATERGIPCVFTTHDYFPICPRTTLIDRTGAYCAGPSPERCAVCCNGVGMTAVKSHIMQSSVYAKLKRLPFAKVFAKKTKAKMMATEFVQNAKTFTPDEARGFASFLEYNKDILGKMHIVLANSAMTEQIYRRFFSQLHFVLIPGTHAGLALSGEPPEPHKKGLPIKIAYFGGGKAYKGYGTLMEACTLLHREGLVFSLDLYGDDYDIPENIPEASSKGWLSPEKVRGILRAHDVVVVPSICHETCGFVVLEALCEGVRVVCSDAVGAADLVEESFVFEAGNSRDLARKLSEASHTLTAVARISDSYPLSMDAQVDALERAYLELMEEDGKRWELDWLTLQ